MVDDNLIQTVRDRIRDTYVNLIPEEQWESMIKKVVDNYFRIWDRGVNPPTRISNFEQDVLNCLQEEVTARTKAYLQQNFQQTWDGSKEILDAKIEQMICKNSGKILADMIGFAFQNMLQNAGYNMR